MTGWPDRSRAAGSGGPVRADALIEVTVAPEGSRYADARLVGAGGMGRVESVYDRGLERVVARKTVIDGGDPALGARLVREARIAARLDHPGIVAVHDVGTDAEGRPWYTMRLIRGSGLDAVVAESVGTDAHLALVPRVLAAVQAVAYAHSVGVIHRDLKPSNVMIGPFGETQVVDWGLARALDDPTPEEGLVTSSGPELTTLGEVVGTPRWMSPEQARGEPADRRSDVYALGGILAFVLAAASEVPADLSAIVRRARADDAAQRYPDAGALATDLEAWLAGRRVSAHAYTARELAERVWRAWRFPLSVVGVASLTLLTGLAVAFTRASAERDRALAAEHSLAGQLAASDVALAAAALAAEDPSSARTHAWRALEQRDLPEARGVLAMTGGLTPMLVQVGAAVPIACDDARLSPQGGGARVLHHVRAHVGGHARRCGALDGRALWGWARLQP